MPPKVFASPVMKWRGTEDESASVHLLRLAQSSAGLRARVEEVLVNLNQPVGAEQLHFSLMSQTPLVSHN